MVVYRGDVLIPLDRNPVETVLLAWAAWTGGRRAFTLLAGGEVSPATALRWEVDLGWHLLLFAGGLVALVGAYWRDAIAGVLLIRWAMWPLGIGCALYAAGLALAGQYGPAVPVAGFAVGFTARAVQITRDLRARVTIARPDA